MKRETVNNTTVLLMTFAISALFLTMIQQFLLALLLSGLFSALARPLYLRLADWTGGRCQFASLLTLLVIVALLLIPAIVFISIVVAQAIDVSQSITPWVKNLRTPGVFTDKLSYLPFYEELLPYQDIVIAKAGEAVSLMSQFLISGLSFVTLGTINFVFMAFVTLYSMYFLQIDGNKLVMRILYYLPLKSSDEHLMLEKFTSVTRATLKGTLLIGLLQGGLAGIAFAVAGINNAVFWGTVMAVLSVIPSIGSALIWIPATIILVAQGQAMTGILLGLFCGLIVGSLDNVLRPILVGKDTKMHELMIFLATLGGIFMFGISGIIVGPLIASLFIVIWELYGSTFKHILPAVDWMPTLTALACEPLAPDSNNAPSISKETPVPDVKTAHTITLPNDPEIASSCDKMN